MNNFIIISEHRVGSRWLHYMFCSMLGLQPSPELDRDRLHTDGIGLINEFLNTERIPKLHRASYWDVESAFGENRLKVLGVVRNPRDRGVSLAFHNRYHNRFPFRQKEFKTDQEAVEFTILDDPGYKKGNLRQLGLMIPGQYALGKVRKLYPYIWIDYNTLLKNNYKCINAINDALDLRISDDYINKAIELHSFKHMSGRNPGQEQRSNLYMRKGVSNDWENWFTDKMIKETELDMQLYNHLIKVSRKY